MIESPLRRAEHPLCQDVRSPCSSPSFSKRKDQPTPDIFTAEKPAKVCRRSSSPAVPTSASAEVESRSSFVESDIVKSQDLSHPDANRISEGGDFSVSTAFVNQYSFRFFTVCSAFFNFRVATQGSEGGNHLEFPRPNFSPRSSALSEISSRGSTQSSNSDSTMVMRLSMFPTRPKSIEDMHLVVDDFVQSLIPNNLLVFCTHSSSSYFNASIAASKKFVNSHRDSEGAMEPRLSIVFPAGGTKPSRA